MVLLFGLLKNIARRVGLHSPLIRSVSVRLPCAVIIAQWFKLSMTVHRR